MTLRTIRKGYMVKKKVLIVNYNAILLNNTPISKMNIWKFKEGLLSLNVFKLPLALSWDIIVFDGLFSHFAF